MAGRPERHARSIQQAVELDGLDHWLNRIAEVGIRGLLEADLGRVAAVDHRSP